MKQFAFTVTVIALLASCGNKEQKNTTVEKTTADSVSFFPVTAYLKGQLYTISKAAVTPLKTISIGGKTDSTWLKLEEIPAAVAEFLAPVIDSANLVPLFTESKFNDQTLNLFTFTYQPKNELPKDFELKRWDVYINPETQKVTRVYLLKSRHDSSFHMTWEADKSCTIKTVVEKPGQPAAEVKEEKITWKF